MAVGAERIVVRPVLADAAGAPSGLCDRPRGRVAIETRHGVFVERGDIDALPVRGDRDRDRVDELVAVGARPRPVLADAAGGPGGLGDRPGGRIAVETRHGVADERRRRRRSFRPGSPPPDLGMSSPWPSGARSLPGLADAAGGPGGLGERPGGRVAVETRHGPPASAAAAISAAVAVRRGYVDTLPVRAPPRPRSG